MKLVSSGGKSQIISGTAYLPMLHGSTPAQYKSNENTAALFSTDPAEVITLRIGIISGNTSVIPAVNFRAVYFTELFDPIDLSQS